MADDALERALATLREGGHRVTPARHAVIATLAGVDGHPGAEELCDRIRERHPAIHRATVYRTLETLTDLGIVTHVHISGGATAYHLTSDVGIHPHLHASCRVCGSIMDLPDGLLDAVSKELRDRLGFELDPRHVALSGTCRACRDAG
ncbi:Fur family transcriptional regulator [Phytoactinopolyspora halotolerans]|uniref:Transcriptional repressor n=1 Tax=Phytoactinopolyspora halotolerans TaxID=1981512 RepID=A0A6L9S8S3_9ACTN|nr:Fur family transcriptional regulator [Phytoactinopolyspora halotolerans]NEE00992.1 transcriptional repressor [Phytoactinopolyspora halotolerans]